jgi:hypothetical protein
MAPQGEYYLHENGRMIYKPGGDVDVMSPFVKGLWTVAAIGESPESFAVFLRQAHQKGAKGEEIHRLAEHNRLADFVPDWESRVFKKVDHGL